MTDNNSVWLPHDIEETLRSRGYAEFTEVVVEDHKLMVRCNFCDKKSSVNLKSRTFGDYEEHLKSFEHKRNEYWLSGSTAHPAEDDSVHVIGREGKSYDNADEDGFRQEDAPYQWQYRNHMTGNWTDFTDSDTIEMNFCKVENEEFNVIMPKSGSGSISPRANTIGTINFEDGKAMLVKLQDSKKPMQVRRVSFSETKWKWYWLDEYNRWKQYVSQSDKKGKPNAPLEDIEDAYHASDGHFEFTDGQKYDIDFSRMVQRSISNNAEMKVRRRPEFTLKKEAKKGGQATTETDPTGAGKAISVKESDTASGGKVEAAEGKTDSSNTPVDWDIYGVFHVGRPKSCGKGNSSLISSYIPDHWDVSEMGDGDGVHYVNLDKTSAKTSDEYQKIEARFKATMAGNTVTSIKRVQNLEVFDAYYRKKIWMKKKSKTDPKELLLFHGTKAANITAICEQGFDCRVSGTGSGTAYGRGTYFGAEASMSAGYTNSKSMFVCKVLVGDYCRGNPSFVRPPQKDAQNFYDSCVNNTANPGMYIIFKPEQAYPEYIIQYQ
ncbi:protein mono-ADP-ribosyltransferase PARP12-like [Lineus longissimus]|uniref:protein mono-ADP-ribosyltransferase PARP12-like n=1 Tax=Lineus longissimus TaxID=88925 RepID=UPI002B4F4693